MRVLVTIRTSPPHRYLVKLHEQSLIDEIVDLLGRQKNSKAIVTALAKGLLERVVSEDEMNGLEADLILSNSSAQWDLT